MVDTHLSNPAGRLWMIYTEASTKPDWTFGRTMRAYLDLPADGPPWDFMPVALDMYQLTVDMEAAVNELLDPHIPATSLLKPVDRIRSTLNADALGSQTNGWVLTSIGNGETLTQLEHCSHLLNRSRAAQAVIDDDTIAEIKALADEIVNLVMEDDLMDPAVRELFLRYAQGISEAAAFYKVTGPQPLVDELDRFYSAARRANPTVNPRLRDQLKKIVGAIVTATALFSAPVDVAHAIEEYDAIFVSQQMIEAPASPEDDSVVLAELEPDELETPPTSN